MSKFRFQSPLRKASNEADMGVEGNAGLYTTNDLPESGHNPAPDDGQQPFTEGSPEHILQGVAESVEASDVKLATRIRGVARELRRKRLAFGITETDTPEFEQKYTTAPLHYPGPDDVSALDDGNQPTDLEFWGTHAPDRSQAGPQPDPSRTAAVEHTDIEDWDDGEEPDEDYGEEVGGHGTCPVCGGELKLLGQLGGVKHYRCRDCGTDFNTGLSKEEEKSEDESEGWEASRRKADPREEWTQDMDDLLEDITDPLYESEEPQLHQVRDELKDVVLKGKTTAPAEGREASRKKKPRESTKKNKTRLASVETPQEVEVWTSLKKSLRRASSGGQWGVGTWRTYTNDYGNVLDFHLDTHDSDGAPRVAGQVTISLDREDPRKRVARVTVHDSLVGKKSRQIDIPYSQINRFARDLAGKLENTGKEFLKGY